MQIKSFFKGNIYLIIAFRIFIVYILYALCRLLFYYYNHSHFRGLGLSELITIFAGGLLFDTSAIVYSNSLYLILFLLPFRFRYKQSYQLVLMILFFTINGIALIANLADIAYYEFSLQRSTMDIFGQFTNEENTGKLFSKFIIDYWYLSLLWIFLMTIMIYLYKRVRISAPKIKSNLWYYISGTVMLVFAIILSIGGARGGFKQFVQPITMRNAWAYVKNPDDAALVLNTPFTIMHSIEKKGYKRVNYYSTKTELENIFTPLHKAIDRPVRKENVVIFIIESFNKEFIGSLNKDLEGGTYKGYTPFVDSLIGVSKVFTHSYANGRKSIDVLPSIFSSLPRIGLPFVLMTPYYRNKLNSLPGLMKEMGYKSAFFHGAPNGSFGFIDFINIIGVDEYYGMNEYNNDKDYDGTWGIWDEEFMQYFANTIDTFSNPFIATLFSVSSHHPFVLPEKHKNRFKKGDSPLEECIQYTDYSLQRFFKTASNMPWFNNTLFIITADHVSINQRPEFQNEIGYFSVPIIFYRPGSNLTGIDTITNAQQIDIMPTVLNYLGYNKDYIAFGKDLFSKEGKNFAFNYLNDTHRLFLDDHLLIFNGEKSSALYHVDNYRKLSGNIMYTKPETKDSMERYVKAFIQQYVNRMIDNKLIVPK